MKTKEQVEKLKQNWLQDPCWDIEDTEGFEDYYFELSVFHTRQRRKWREAQQRKDDSTRFTWYATLERWIEGKGWLCVGHRSYESGKFYETYLTPNGAVVQVYVVNEQIQEANTFVVSERE